MPLPPFRSVPDDATILRIESPAFETRPPRLINADLIPEAVRRSMAGAWSAGGFPVRVVRWVRLRDVWVAKEGLVFDSEGALYRETVTQHSSNEIEVAAAAVRTAMEDPSPVEDRGAVVLCKKRGVDNYGHWMMEMLPRAALAVSRLPPDPDRRYLVAATTGRLAENMAETLAPLGIDPSRVIRSGDEPRRYDEVLTTIGLTDHGAFMSPLVLEAADVVSASVPANKYPRLLVLRRSAGFRMLADEEAILHEALKRGYVGVDPGLMTVREQAAVFKGAERVVGIMGAAMTNIVFSAPGTRVINLAPAGMPDTFFWFLANLRGLDYTEARCPQIGKSRGNAVWDTDITLDPALFDRVFDEN